MNEADPDPERIEPDVMTYEVAGETGHFISFEDPVEDLLIGSCRLRFPGNPVRREPQDVALVRELHVYGSEAGIGADDDWQHKGCGKKLLAYAEELSRDAGYDKISVISGIGVRQYYKRKLDHHQNGSYVSKRL